MRAGLGVARATIAHASAGQTNCDEEELAMSRAKTFRELIRATEILQIPCCYDGASAKVLEQTGFKAIAAAGYGLSGSLLGMPDIGLLSGPEMVNQYKNISDAVDVPLFVDIDTGFGDVNNVIRAVRDAEEAGVAGLFIEDQTYPKRCGHMAGKNVVDVADYLPKLKAALWARRDPDFVITARTDSLAVHGLDEAVRRAKIFADVGADMVFVEAVHTVEEMQKINAVLHERDTPSMANIIEGGDTPLLSVGELQDLGYSAVAYPCGAIFAAITAVQDWARHVLHDGGPQEVASSYMNFDEYFDFIGANAIRQRESKFV
jgi:methylisocitrate lyase